MDTAFEAVWGFLRVLQSGVATQWWGLACPPHSEPRTFGLVLAAYLLGFLSCLGLAAFLLLWSFGFQLPIHLRAAAAAQPSSRLSRYLDATVRTRQRGHSALP